MKLLDFKIALAKSLIGTYNSRSPNTPLSHVPHREVLPTSLPLHLAVLQTTRVKCRYCCTGQIENKTLIVTYMELPAINLEIVLRIFLLKFKGNKHFICCYSIISSLSFTLTYLSIILFILVCNALMRNSRAYLTFILKTITLDHRDSKVSEFHLKSFT